MVRHLDVGRADGGEVAEIHRALHSQDTLLRRVLTGAAALQANLMLARWSCARSFEAGDPPLQLHVIGVEAAHVPVP